MAVIQLDNLSASGPNDEAADALVADEHIRSAAEKSDRDAAVARDPQRLDKLVRRARFAQPVRRPANLERREWRQGGLGAKAIRAEPRVHRLAEARASLRQTAPPGRAARHPPLRASTQ